MKSKTLIVAIISLIFTSSALAQTQRLREAGNVPMVEVLTDPSKFEGKKVLLHGVFVYEFESSALYLTKESAEYGISVDAVWLDIDSDLITKNDLDKLNGKYVSAFGTLDKDQFGHMGAFRATVKVERIELLKKYRKL